MLSKGAKNMGRRSFSREFKLSAVKLVQEQGYTVVEAAKSLGVDAGSIRGWVKQLATQPGSGVSSDSAMRAELRRLREENKRLLMEREILKKATAFFAKQQP
jgi:transposase